MNIYAEAVAKGAALLDEKRPGWEFEVDWRMFDIRRTTYCVLGQLFGDDYPIPYGKTGYARGLEELELLRKACKEPNCYLCKEDATPSISYGFNVGNNEDGDDWNALHDAWLTLATARGASDVPGPISSQ